MHSGLLSVYARACGAGELPCQAASLWHDKVHMQIGTCACQMCQSGAAGASPLPDRQCSHQGAQKLRLARDMTLACLTQCSPGAGTFRTSAFWPVNIVCLPTS